MRTYFISSTFRDMQAERDLINRQVLPKFRAEARAHGEHADVVDLRIGIDTLNLDLNAAMRKVLRVCRQEIDHSKPFMIIFLGEKYGSLIEREHLPKEFVKELVKRKSFVGKSVTEFEIDYGLFEQFASKCLICFRTLRGEFSADDRKKFFDAEGSVAAAKLAALKDRLRRDYNDKIIEYTADWNGTELENFSVGEKSLADVLLERMKNDCRADWSEYESLPWQKREQQASWQQVMRRAVNFFGRENLIANLEEIFLSGDKIIFLSGERGTGKTSLLSKIAFDLSRQSRRVHCIFSGSSPYSETAQKILEQMIFFLEEDLNLEHKPLDDAEEVYSQLQLRLKELSEHVEPSQPVHFVIDAVDMLATDRHKEFLDFLPITGNVRCLVSGANNFDFKAAMRAHTSTRLETLEFLADAEVSAVLEKILAQRGKQLFPNVAAAVQEKIGRTSPLYLEMVAQAVGMMSAAEFAAAGNVDELAALTEKFIRNLPAEPKTAAPYLIKTAARTLCNKPAAVLNAINLIAISRHGLRVSDLKAMMQDFDDLDNATLRMYLDNFFSESSGLIRFSHDLIREGICDELDEKFFRDGRRQIAEHVKNLPADDDLRRLDGANCAQDINDYKFLATLYGEAFTTKNQLLLYGITQALISDGGATCIYMLKNCLNDFDEKTAAECYGFLFGDFSYILINSAEEIAIKHDIIAALPNPPENVRCELFKLSIDIFGDYLPKFDSKKLLNNKFFIEHIGKIYGDLQELRLIEIAFVQGDFKAVKNRCKKICHWGEKNFHPMYSIIMSRSYRLLSDAYFFLKDLPEAAEAAQQSIRWMKYSVKALPVDKCLLELATAYAHAAIRENALERPSLKKILRWQEKAREIYAELLKKSNDLIFWVQATSNAFDIAQTNFKMGNPEKALSFAEEAERRTEELLLFYAGNFEIIFFSADMYGSLALIYIHLKNPKARAHISRSLELCRRAYEINPADYVRNAPFNIAFTAANTYREIGDEAHAQIYFNMAQEFLDEN